MGPCKYYLSYVNYTLSKGGYFRNGHKSVGMIAVVWCFATFVFVNIYSTCLTSYMSLTFQRPAINSFGDLAMAKDYDLTVVKGSNAEVIFLVKRFHISLHIYFILKMNNNRMRNQENGRKLETNYVTVLEIFATHKNSRKQQEKYLEATSFLS